MTRILRHYKYPCHFSCIEERDVIEVSNQVVNLFIIITEVISSELPRHLWRSSSLEFTLYATDIIMSRL